MSESAKQDALNDINTVLQTGVLKEQADGNSTEFNHDTLREERARLERKLGIGQHTPGVFRFGRGGC